MPLTMIKNSDRIEDLDAYVIVIVSGPRAVGKTQEAPEDRVKTIPLFHNRDKYYLITCFIFEEPGLLNHDAYMDRVFGACMSYCRRRMRILVEAGSDRRPEEKREIFAVAELSLRRYANIYDGVEFYLESDKDYIWESKILADDLSAFISDKMPSVDQRYSLANYSLEEDSSERDHRINYSYEEDVGSDNDELETERAEETDTSAYLLRFDPETGFRDLDESFGETVLRLIGEKNMTEVECYKRANLSRAAFYKIRQNAINPNTPYRPSKQTVLALAIALELSLGETEDLLSIAGYALSHSNKGDVIVEYFLAHRLYDIFEINEFLYSYDQPLLGSL